MTSHSRVTPRPSPYTRWLVSWLKCDEAPGALVLADSSGNGNHVSPNYAPVWQPNFTVGAASYLSCMRPGNTSAAILLEPTAVGVSGVGITSSGAEPTWPAAGGTLTENVGNNSITWTARTPTISFSGSNGVICGLGGAVCVPRSRSLIEHVMGWLKTDNWEYTAATLSCSATGINDSFGAIPAGLVAGDVVLATGWTSKDDQMFGVVNGTPTASDILITGGFALAEAAGATVTLRRVHLPHSVAIAAWCTPLTNSATTFAGQVMRAAMQFGTGGSQAGLVANLREDGTKRVVIDTYSPAGLRLSMSTVGQPINTPMHVVWVWDRVAGFQLTYLNGVQGSIIAATKNSRCVLRDVPDATYYTLRDSMLQFFAGGPNAAYRDVQLYAAFSLPLGINSDTRWNSLVQKIYQGNGPILATEWP